jgi:hypothetical protein
MVTVELTYIGETFLRQFNPIVDQN